MSDKTNNKTLQTKALLLNEIKFKKMLEANKIS